MAYLLFIDYYVQSAVNPHIRHSCCIVLQRTGWLMIVTEINKLALQCKNNSHFLPCRSCSNSILKSLEDCNYDATRFSRNRGVSPSSTPRFFLLAVIFRTTLNKIKFFNISNNTYSGTRRSSSWYASNFHFYTKIWIHSFQVYVLGFVSK